MVKAMFMGETNISMDDDDMNYMVKAAMKDETNISMVDGDMKFLVKAVIKGENNISIKIWQDYGILWNTLAYSGIL